MTALLSLMGLAVSAPVDAATASLQVCNHGTVTIDVFVARHIDALTSTGWQVKSARLLPGACQTPYLDVTGSSGFDGPAAYIGFGFTDARGQWIDGQFQETPDIGFVGYGVVEAALKHANGHPVLAKAQKRMCVRRGATSYSAAGEELERDCSTFHITDGDRGQWVSLTAAFYFVPAMSRCSTIAGSFSCAGGEYYLNVAAVGNSRLMAAEMGTDKGGSARGNSSLAANSDAAKELREYARQQREQETAQRAAARTAEEAANRKRVEAAAARGDAFAKQVLATFEHDEQEARKKWSAPRRSPAAYDPKWMDDDVVIRGTVSRVEIKENSTPMWVTVLFKESPDAKFAVCSPNPALFREKFGDAYWDDLVGRTLEVQGRVEAPYCGAKAGSVRVVEWAQLRIPTASENYAKYVEPAGPRPARLRPAGLSRDDMLRIQEHPAKLGKVEVDHVAGLAFADMTQRATRVYGQPIPAGATEQKYGPDGTVVVSFASIDGSNITRVKRVAVGAADVAWVRAQVQKACGTATNCTNDAVLDMIGKSEADITGLLGAPKRREANGGNAYTLYWTFDMGGFPAGEANAKSDQTLALGFAASSRCVSIALTW